MKYSRHIYWMVILILILSSCTPQKRLHRLLALHPELTENEIVEIRDTTFIRETRLDTFVHIKTLLDTVTITKEKIRVNIHQVRDTVYINARQEKDTVVVVKDVPVEKIVYAKGRQAIKIEWDYFLVILMGFILLLAVALIKR